MIQNKKNELDVDFIGGMEPLTREDEKAITEYINAKKLQINKKPPVRKLVSVKRANSLA